MKPQVPHELISAYFDGEVTPEERAAVENLLAENDEAQRELNETARLSALLHSFPRESAPVELVDNVLRQTSQLPLPTLPKPAPPPAPKRHVWLQLRAAFIAVATTSIVFLIVINTGLTTQRGESMAKNDLRAISAATPAVQPVTMADDLPMPKAAEPFASDATTLAQQQPPAPKAPAADFADQKSFQRQDTTMSTLAPKPTAPVLGAAQQQVPPVPPGATNFYGGERDLLAETLAVDNYNNPISNSVFLNELKTNGVILTVAPKIADPDLEVPVIDVELINLDRDVKKFVVLLEDLQIRPWRPEDKRDANEKPKDPDDEVVVVFTYATTDRLAAVLEKLDEHRESFAGWSKQLPLQLASNDSGAENKDELSKQDGPRPSLPSKKLDRSEPPSEGSEVDRALDALVERGNTLRSNGAGFGANQVGRATMESRRRTEKEEITQRGKPAAGKGGASNTENPTQQGQRYAVARVQNATGAIPPLQFPANRNQELDAARNSRLPANVTTAEKAAQQVDGTNARAYRMLFVLHPQSTPPSVPASKQP